MKDKIMFKDFGAWLFIILLYFVVAYFVLTYFFEPEDSVQDLCLYCNNIYSDGNDYTVNEINVLIDKIAKDCGSTHIVKEFESPDWSVFKRIHKDGWEKFEYVKLSDCLK